MEEEEAMLAKSALEEGRVEDLAVIGYPDAGPARVQVVSRQAFGAGETVGAGEAVRLAEVTQIV